MYHLYRIKSFEQKRDLQVVMTIDHPTISQSTKTTNLNPNLVCAVQHLQLLLGLLVQLLEEGLRILERNVMFAW